LKLAQQEVQCHHSNQNGLREAIREKPFDVNTT